MEDLAELLNNLKPIDKREQNEILLAKLEKLLCSKYNSEEISENHVFTIELKVFQKSFVEFCEAENVYSVHIDQIRSDQIKFKELLRAYDHKNVTFEDGLANIFITSEDVEVFEASNLSLCESK